MSIRRSLTTITAAGLLALGATTGTALAKHGADDPPSHQAGDDHGRKGSADDNPGKHRGRGDDASGHKHGADDAPGHRRGGDDDGPGHH